MECNLDAVRFEHAVIGKIHTQAIVVKNVTGEQLFIWMQPEKPYNICLSCQEDDLRMTAPGQTKILKLEFLPQLEQNITATVRIEGIKTNKQKVTKIIRVECLMQEALFKCDASQVNFGRVILGEAVHRQIELKSQGIGPVCVEFLSSKNIPVSRKKQWPKQQLQSLEQLSIPQKIEMSDNTLQVNIEYRPSVCGNFKLEICIRVINNLRVKPIKLLLIGQAIGVPVVSLFESYDFKICLAGHTYKQWLEFRNFSNTAAKVQVSQPNETRKYFQFDPSLTYISKQSTLKMCVTFRAEREIWSQLSRFGRMLNSSGRKYQRYEVPMELITSAQQTPVKFYLCFTLTSDKLIITPQVVDFGKVYAGTASKYELQLKNQSLLEQQVMLIPDSKNLIVDMDQPVRLLPSQIINCRLLYRSQCDMTKSENRRRKSDSRSEECSLLCMAITGNVSVQDIRLLCICTVISPELQVSCNKINLPVVQIEQTYDANFRLTNKAQSSIVFQVFLPYFELCGLKITPMVKSLLPGETTELSVEYTSFFKKMNANILAIVEQNNMKQQLPFDQIIRRARSSSSVSHISLQSINKLTKQPTEELNIAVQLAKLGGKYVEIDNGQCFQWLIPIYFKQKDFPDASAETVYIQISTISVPKTLLISQSVVNFGEVSVGSYEIRQLEITNLDVDSEVWKSQLHPFCGFEVINSLKVIRKDETCKLIIRFKPLEQTYFQEKLIIKTNHSIVNVILKGSGVRPEIDIYPCDGRLDMGHIMVHTNTMKTLRISNLTVFPVRFRLKIKQEAVRNRNGLSAFTYIPSQGYINGDGYMDVSIQFRPDKPSDHYFQTIVIQVQQQKVQRQVFIFGSSHEFPVYVYQKYPVDTFNKEHVFDQLEQNQPIHLKTRSNTLKIGCCQSNSSVQYGFYLESDDKAVKAEPAEGRVKPGQEKTISVRVKEDGDEGWPNIGVLAGISWIKQTKFSIHVTQDNNIMKSFDAMIQYEEST